MKVVIGLMAVVFFVLAMFLIVAGAKAIHPGLAMMVMGAGSFFLFAILAVFLVE